MKKISIALLCSLISLGAFAQQNKMDQMGWKLGVQSYTFHKFSYQQAVDKANQLGLNYIEVYFGQDLGEGMDGAMDYNMDKSTRSAILKYAKSKNVKIFACGVAVCSSEEEWDQLFKFADNMGIKVVTCEPDYDLLKHVDELANKYQIDVAIHNHPKPSAYWTPELFLTAVEGMSERIGACADVGHWKRMGLDPVECIKKYEGRMKSLHFKDIKEKVEGEEEQHDVIWGTGIIDIEGVMLELKRQKFKGLFSIEYEYNWDNSVPDIKENINYFYKKVDVVL